MSGLLERPMTTIRCPFCHKYIDDAAYPAHEAGHRKLRPDGQQSEYVTLPPKEREQGSLAGVPKVYRHWKCGVATGMPEEIIRSYLKNPCLYDADRTFCCACGRHVPFRECVWVETGEDLQTYMDRLRKAKPGMKPKRDLGAGRADPGGSVMRKLLQEVRAALGPAPRVMEENDLAALIPCPPPWFPKKDRLAEVYRQLDLLLLDGEVVWSSLIQANNNLFKPEPHDHPALAIHAADRSFDDRPADLQTIARRLFHLKNTTPEDRDERRVADMITDEMERGMGWAVPRSLTDGEEVLATTFMVFRSHLPGRRLHSGWFPLLIHAETPAIMIVPSTYWPRELTRRWSAAG
jgi:hypothetical protein